MSQPESTPKPTPEPPDELLELSRYARDPAEVPTDVPTEPRPPIVSGLRAWWLPMAGLLVAMAFVATDHMLRAGVSFGGSMLLAAGLRAFLPESLLGGLVVRARWVDVAMLVIGGVVVLVSAFTLDLRDLRT